MSLVKKYSQMTEEQRKELFKQAFEAKQKLQEKLKEKEKELEKMQHQVCVFISYIYNVVYSSMHMKTVKIRTEREREREGLLRCQSSAY